MTPEQQRRAIAEWMGWKQSPIAHLHFWNDETQEATMVIPNYYGDLNAIATAERRLDHSQWNTYVTNLDMVCVPLDDRVITHSLAVICATAAQRAEALLRTIGKWKEDAK